MTIGQLLRPWPKSQKIPVLATLPALKAIIDREISSITIEKSGEHDRVCLNLEALK